MILNELGVDLDKNKMDKIVYLLLDKARKENRVIFPEEVNNILKSLVSSSSIAFSEKTIWQVSREDFLKQRLVVLSQRGGTNIAYIFKHNPNIIIKVMRSHAIRRDSFTDEVRLADIDIDIVPGLRLSKELGNRAVGARLLQGVKFFIEGRQYKADVLFI